jgi:hypothetical protein
MKYPNLALVAVALAAAPLAAQSTEPPTPAAQSQATPESAPQSPPAAESAPATEEPPALAAEEMAPCCEPVGELCSGFEPAPPAAFAPAPTGDPVRRMRDAWNQPAPPLASGATPTTLDRLRGRASWSDDGDLYLRVQAFARAELDEFSVPTSSGTPGPSAKFFGSDGQSRARLDAAIVADAWQLEHGTPWRIWSARVALAAARQLDEVGEPGVLSPDLLDGEDRGEGAFGIEEAWFEHVLTPHDASTRWSARVGVLPLRSDFRGFVYDDSNLGLLLSGANDAYWSWELALFDRRDRDTETGLLEVDEARDQVVAVARLRRDEWAPFVGERVGYATEFSLHWSADSRDEHVDDDGFSVAPPPFGAAQSGDVDSIYLGWAGEGQLDEHWDVSHAVYQVYGSDDANPIAAKKVDIDARLAAIELGTTRGPFRFAFSALHASGDSDANDGKGGGFDAILDAPRFAGAGSSFWARHAWKLVGTKLKSEWSPLPDLSPSQNEGHQGFVNPGLDLLGASAAWSADEALRASAGLSWLSFDDTDSLETLLQIGSVEREIGWELWAGADWRPTRQFNARVELGASVLLPGGGIERVYGDDDPLWGVFVAVTLGI